MSGTGAPVWVTVGSTNPVKGAAVEDAFSAYFGAVRVQGAAVSSGVPEQPMGDETMRGARNRARALASLPEAREADYRVGIEGGLLHLGDRWFALGCMCVLDPEGREGRGTSPLFELPDGIVQRLRAGEELGPVIDEISGEPDSKRKGGAIGCFTRGIVTRRVLYRAGLLVALVPFLNPHLYYARAAG